LWRGDRSPYACATSSLQANKNAVPGDTRAATPGGVRLGTPALTTRGLQPEQCDALAGLLARAAVIAVAAQAATPGGSPRPSTARRIRPLLVVVKRRSSYH